MGIGSVCGEAATIEHHNDETSGRQAGMPHVLALPVVLLDPFPPSRRAAAEASR